MWRSELGHASQAARERFAARTANVFDASQQFLQGETLFRKPATTTRVALSYGTTRICEMCAHNVLYRMILLRWRARRRVAFRESITRGAIDDNGVA